MIMEDLSKNTIQIQDPIDRDSEQAQKVKHNLKQAIRGDEIKPNRPRTAAQS